MLLCLSLFLPFIYLFFKYLVYFYTATKAISWILLNMTIKLRLSRLLIRLLDDLLNIDNPYFEGMVKQIYPPELHLNKANNTDTEAPFLDLHLSIANGFVSSKIYDKRDDFDFDIVNFPFLDGDVPRRASYGVYISQLLRFARVCNHIADFNARNKCLTAKLLQQDYRYYELRKTFSKFYRRHYELISIFNVGLKKVQVGKDQEKAQSEKDSHSKNRGGKKPNLYHEAYRKPNEQLFSQ